MLGFSSRVFAGCMGFFFKFLEGRILLEFFHVVSQIRFFLFDLFFFQGSGECDWSRLRCMLGSNCPIAIHVPIVDVVAFVLFFCSFFRGLATEHRCHIHLLQALMFAVPVGRLGIGCRFVDFRWFIDVAPGLSLTGLRKQRLVRGENLRDGRRGLLLPWNGRRATGGRGPRLRHTLIFGDGFSRQNNGLISRRRPVIRAFGAFRPPLPFAALVTFRPVSPFGTLIAFRTIWTRSFARRVRRRMSKFRFWKALSATPAAAAPASHSFAFLALGWRRGFAMVGVSPL